MHSLSWLENTFEEKEKNERNIVFPISGSQPKYESVLPKRKKKTQEKPNSVA